MLAAVVGLAVGLAAVAKLRQQLAHRVRADRVPLGPQGGGELLMALGDPAQRPHRIAQRDRFDELTQILQQVGSLALSGCRLPPSRRTRPLGSGAWSRSFTPRPIVPRDSPVARATASR